MSAPLPWQTTQWNAISGARATGRLHHALLAAGPPGIGKATFLAALTAWLLCEAPRGEEPCGECRGCQQHAAGSHPDCIVLSPDYQSRPVLGAYPGQRCQYEPRRKPSGIISVEQVRELGERLHASAHYGGFKLAVLLPADALNTAAANALLKLLEEPPDNTLFLLLSQRLARLPATVRSRCQMLRFNTPPLAQARAALSRTGPEADLALELAGGAPLRAQELLVQDIAAVWKAVCTGLGALLDGKADPLRLSRDWLKLPQEALDAALYGWLRQALRRAGGDRQSGNARGLPSLARLRAFGHELEDFLRLREHPLVKDLALQRLLQPLWAGTEPAT